MRNAGRLKLGFYPLPVEEASNLWQILISVRTVLRGGFVCWRGNCPARSHEGLRG